MRYLALLVLLVGCSPYFIPGASLVLGPKFKEGDCITYLIELEDKNEFLQEDLSYRQIVKVGKVNYLFRYNFGPLNESPISRLDNIMTRIECPK